MTVFRTYKFLTGAFLLALYAFVATPVQYWHHHKVVVHAAKQDRQVNSQQDLVFQDDGAQQDANCAVCSHKYATYSEIAIIAFEPSDHIAGTKNGYYHLPAATAPSFPLPNKGPPSTFM